MHRQGRGRRDLLDAVLRPLRQADHRRPDPPHGARGRRLREDHVGIGTDGSLSALVIDDKLRTDQKKFFEERTAKGIAAPGKGPDVFNMVAELKSPMRFRLLFDALEKAGWPGARIDKVLGGNLLRLYGEVWGA